MTNTPELQKAFRQSGWQRKGCRFPVAHLLALFDYGTGPLIRVAAAPVRTHDWSLSSAINQEMAAGDVVVGDRGFCSHAHLTLRSEAGIHGVFRIHQATPVSFHRGRKKIAP